MPEANNVDALLVQAMNQQVAPTAPPPEPIAPVEAPAETTQEDINQSIEEPVEQSQNVSQESDNVSYGTSKDEKASADSPIDEYGNPVEKPKMYSEDDVQRMIKDRLARSRHDTQPPPQQHTQPPANDTNTTEDNWEAELEKFVDKTIDKRQQKLAEQQWQAKEQAIQAAYEDKFNAGMAKYNDFQPVVKKVAHNLTTDMMMATRALDNPAAFIYGAAKMHPQELERIAKIPDGYQQALEMGRLHEKMLKNSRVVSQAGKPLETPKGDMPPVINKQPSLEERIAQHAQSKRR